MTIEAKVTRTQVSGERLECDVLVFEPDRGVDGVDHASIRVLVELDGRVEIVPGQSPDEQWVSAIMCAVMDDSRVIEFQDAAEEALRNESAENYDGPGSVLDEPDAPKGYYE